jgi:vitamin-K-epoxide reductase (warfarin-sensitive)
MNARARRLLLAIAMLASAGTLVSSVSLYHHYGREETTYCDFGQSFNCDIVNRSAYSSVMGIPVALIGMLGYLGLFGLATVHRTKAETPPILLLVSLVGLAFALYLTYVEGFVLNAWCVLCLSSLGIITAIAGSSAVLVGVKKLSERSGKPSVFRKSI